MKVLRSISSKVIVIYVALAVMNIAFLTTIAFENQVDLITDNAKLEAEKLVFSISSSLNRFLSDTRESRLFRQKGSRNKINAVINVVKPVVSDFMLVKENGEIIRMSNSRIVLPEAFSQNAAKAITNRDFTGKSYFLTVDEDKYKLNFYLPLDEYFLKGTILFISYNIKDINKRMKDLYIQAFMIVIVISIFHIIFAMLLFGIIIRPIQVLNQKSREVALGNYSVRVNLSQDDELGDLSTSFNTMAESIEDNVKKLNEQMKVITETKDKIEVLATVDELTNLYNRRFFFTRLNEEIERAMREKGTLGLIIADIDHFKVFNDKYGHQVGDIVLAHVAQIVKNSCRSIDIVARYGGEEIVIAAPNCPMEEIGELAERIRKNVEKTSVVTPSGLLAVTVSIGATSFDELMFESLDNIGKMLFYFSDTALYQAKESGRNAVYLG